jgi:hypothetical protein
MKLRQWFMLFVVLVAACLAVVALRQTVTIPTAARDRAALPVPSPDRDPRQVVRIVVDALRENDTPEPDTGITITFRFASPANRAATGPLEWFILMVKSRRYVPFLMPNTAEYRPMVVRGSEARQAVRLTVAGRIFDYLFVLSRQQNGECPGCWMTDGVFITTTLPRTEPRDVEDII